MKRFKITEEQYKAFNESIRLDEVEKTQNGIKAQIPVTGKNTEETNKAINAAKKIGDTTGVEASVVPEKTTSTGMLNCSRIITKKQIKENILGKLKKNSKVYSASDFLKKL